jgi:hypothetical protein
VAGGRQQVGLTQSNGRRVQRESSDVQFVMPFVDERFDTIHQLLRKQNLSVMPGPFQSQVDIFKAYRESAQIIARTFPHEAGHAIIGLALDAGDVLEWIAV